VGATRWRFEGPSSCVEMDSKPRLEYLRLIIFAI
jgi:hypothetical protein